MTKPDLGETSLAILRAGQAPGGAFIAGPTFSQYGYAWLRDGAFIAEALDSIGEHGMAARFHAWVAGVVLDSATGIERAIGAGRGGRRPDPADYLHCRYTPDGAPGPEDWPTFQLDGPGIWLWALGRHQAATRADWRSAEPDGDGGVGGGGGGGGGGVGDGGVGGGDVGDGGVGGLDTRTLKAALLVGRYLAALWSIPSNDAWEEFPDEIHTSTLAADLAGLRALQGMAAAARADVEIDTAIEAIGRRLLAHRDGNGAWTKWAGNDRVDASLLWLAAPYGLVGAADPAFAPTLARIERELVEVDGGVHRYRDDTYYGGGEWLLLTAAWGRVLLDRSGPGDRARAEDVARWIAAQTDATGQLPEQVATHLLHPDRIAEWQAMWGESACPLLWSHATYLALRAALDRAATTDGTTLGHPLESGVDGLPA